MAVKGGGAVVSAWTNASTGLPDRDGPGVSERGLRDGHPSQFCPILYDDLSPLAWTLMMPRSRSTATERDTVSSESPGSPQYHDAASEE
jgi:hypothetical protein